MTATKGVPVKLGGKSRLLRYTNRAFVRLEEEMGLSLGQVGERVSGGSIKATAAMVWAGLLHADPALELDDVVDMLPLGDLSPVAEAVGKALSAAFGDAEGAPGKA
jgi:hypothetical protein